jgi:single-stranded DNA-binding protein
MSGRLIYREWETKSGAKRQRYQVVGKVFYGAAQSESFPDGEDDA